MKLIYSLIVIILISCSGSDSSYKKDCRAIKDPYNDDITHFQCPDGTNYSSAMAAGINDGDVVDLQTQIDIMEVK